MFHILRGLLDIGFRRILWLFTISLKRTINARALALKGSYILVFEYLKENEEEGGVQKMAD